MTGSRFYIGIDIVREAATSCLNMARENVHIELRFVRGGDIRKLFACLETNQTACEFVVYWHVGEMTRLFTIDGFKFDPDEKNPNRRKTQCRFQMT